ncbi:MAG: hypothetical protein COS85_06370 [Armatimonadetes bacterium CG07_land_8_20_14_0_80_59_28]|nr:MAG: hypothetical protein COS85_06370 [Armatimonadetes bacterium CG07_land_8_20_14_0_80_59_28]PIX43646.1 MAG: hypothetical protein COZ56_06670 [Armatimonadetes bacterium CG_4_8_14_3_um_filter_58_9]PIY49485.1 MAG: hypothetical protein COZ05_00230 [Armatimonadetes bacterium CG_4_10_14_3_um_filter_59_10]
MPDQHPTARVTVDEPHDCWRDLQKQKQSIWGFMGFLVLCALTFLTVPSHGREGRLDTINGYRVLHVAGTPRQMGERHGRLLGNEVRRMVDDLVHPGGSTGWLSYQKLIEGTKVMERHIPSDFCTEMRSLSKAAGVEYEDLVAAQLFGDVSRATRCTSFALFGSATATGELIMGRNLDYWDNGVSEYAAVLIHFKPAKGIPFVTVTWAGIINGWTVMNARGIVCSNNNSYGRSNSLEGISTCFMLRKIAQQASSLNEAERILRTTPRACGTNMLVAQAHPANAFIAEYDHSEIVFRRAARGYVIASNHFRKLYQDEDDEPWCYRYRKVEELISENYGQIDRSFNLAGEDGVPITSMNLHSAMLYPATGDFCVAMGKIPACEQEYRWFHMDEDGVARGK